jgi:Ni,Fe-hydrogenase III large subunit
MYVVFKGMDNTIARCKVRDPSVFNWHVFPQAVHKKKDEKGHILENILADFPLINKSFNLSYAGHDL